MSASISFGSCPACGGTDLKIVDTHAIRCPRCNLLLNRETRALDYSGGGGQEPPDAHKMHWRRENARRRLAIIAPHLSGHHALIDIGCGSGEMLLEAASFPLRIGFDTDQSLTRYIREQHGLPVITAAFDAASLPPEFMTAGKVFSLSHVIEHLEQPNDLILQVKQVMAPGDLMYIEVPLHTGKSFRDLGYRWNLWTGEHLALWSLPALAALAKRNNLEVIELNTRIFARGSRSMRTRLRLLFSAPFSFLKAALTKPAHLSLADVLVADYGYALLQQKR